jgi:iron(III) transport system substrate-binding protein
VTHIALIVLIMCLNAACVKADKQVTVYVALDRQLAEPLLKQFEADTEIRVRPVYDSESNKTSGLVNRLLAEASRPRADVFWNNETAQMYRLSERGVLVNQRSPAGQDMDSSFDEVSQWSSFAARGRVMVIRPSLIDGDAPASITALVDPRWKGRARISRHFSLSGGRRRFGNGYVKCRRMMSLCCPAMRR